MTRLFDRMRSADADAVADTPPAGNVGDLRHHKHLLLVTYRRGGGAVPTPVWFGVDESGAVYCRSGADDAKVRRIRNNPQVLIAPCDRRGAPMGPPLTATARVLAPGEEATAERAISANFGLGRRIYKRLLGDALPAVYIELVPTTQT